ncbi:hypothetical protein KY284_000855 [Solanum tuberosum]|nr:hypothetical protein KY284_000855 [Solanum tuberosum]
MDSNDTASLSIWGPHAAQQQQTEQPTQPDVEREENTDKPSTDSLPMNFIIWNTRETNSSCFGRHCNAFVSIHKPAMMALLETKMTNHTKITQDLGFDSQTQSSAKGLLGGIVIMWKKDNIKLDNFSVKSQGIHSMVKVNTDPHFWLFFALYASSDYRRRTTLWENLLRISCNYQWVV